MLIDWVIGYVMARRFARLPGLDRVEITSSESSSQEIRFPRGSEADVDYPVSFFFDKTKGHVILSGKRSYAGNEVICQVQRWVTGSPQPKMFGFINGWLASSPIDFDIDASTVNLQNGKWKLPATQVIRSSTWVILVHGRTAKRAETYRAMRIFLDRNFSCLAISLRNNHEATTTRSRISHFGSSEATDLAVAVTHARANGAKRILIYAISMGAIATAEYLRAGNRVDAVILDSPALDWQATLLHQAKQVGVSARATDRGITVIGSKLGSRILGLTNPVNLRQIGFSHWSKNFEIPILLLHSKADDYVPIAPAILLSKSKPDFVHLVVFEKARHVQLFNSDPVRYRKAISDFVRSLSK